MAQEHHIETTGSLSQKTGVNQATIRLYEKLGLLECIRTDDGRRLFPASAIAKVRAIYKDRMKGKGYVRADA